jgi:hypothetical protein
MAINSPPAPKLGQCEPYLQIATVPDPMIYQWLIYLIRSRCNGNPSN